MTNLSLYHASITAMLAYKQAEGELNTFIAREVPMGRVYASWEEQINILKQHQALIKARDKARREYEKAEREWKREYARSNNKEKI